MEATSPRVEQNHRFGMAAQPVYRLHNYALLMKPRVMSLVVFTGVVGLIMAPGTVDAFTGAVAVLCIAFGAGAAGAINMWYDRDIDAHMNRTMNRPLPAGRLRPAEALCLGILFAVGSVIAMTVVVNAAAGTLLAVTIAVYIFIYTIWLKRRTPQNIVIGGAAGAFPPMIGWAAVTGGVDAGSVVLFMIIFMWTPPHFWALALFRTEDYARVNVPMLPVVAGRGETKKQILIYTALLVPVTLAPSAIGMASLFYGAVVFILGLRFGHHAVRVWRDDTMDNARAMFLFSILYLFLVFVALLADKGLSSLL